MERWHESKSDTELHGVHTEFRRESNSASRGTLWQSCEIRREAPLKIYSVKLRVHSVQLRVELIALSGRDRRGE